MKRFLGRVTLLGVVAAFIAVAVWLKNHAVPPPQLPEGQQPAWRPGVSQESPPQVSAVRDGVDLGVVKGIGPVYKARLADQGITTLAQLADAETADVASAIEVPIAQVEGWQDQARALR